MLDLRKKSKKAMKSQAKKHWKKKEVKHIHFCEFLAGVELSPPLYPRLDVYNQTFYQKTFLHGNTQPTNLTRIFLVNSGRWGLGFKNICHFTKVIFTYFMWSIEHELFLVWCWLLTVSISLCKLGRLYHQISFGL